MSDQRGAKYPKGTPVMVTHGRTHPRRGVVVGYPMNPQYLRVILDYTNNPITVPVSGLCKVSQ